VDAPAALVAHAAGENTIRRNLVYAAVLVAVAA
jgi:hypothetical protein